MAQFRVQRQAGRRRQKFGFGLGKGKTAFFYKGDGAGAKVLGGGVIAATERVETALETPTEMAAAL
ncbi:hypothetical protein IGS74_16430 [Aureimonas sp. OT7]|uniref:hypothetical protein n=1 Tax=Aureimonas sp. OT7 TaxID=2816454 RepID=UPI0017803370|nr:hypothetical protein [Aureimonas sp. OT7]QOG06118.1 hypothetical protein IGS74_16430 [Aureimonas sp. OT7]